MKTLIELKEQRDVLLDEVEAIVSVAEKDGRELTEDESTRIAAINDTELGKLKEQIENREKIDAALRERAAARLGDQVPMTPADGVGQIGNDGGNVVDMASIRVPARAKSTKALQVFKGANAEQEAYVAGHFYLASLFGRQQSLEMCQSIGLISGSMTGVDGGKGGFLIPDVLSTTLVRLREARSVFSQYARSVPMGSAVMDVPRIIGDVTAYWLGEGDTITDSDADLGNATLVAKKLGCLTKQSSELDEDAVVEIGEMITQSMAYSMADKLDQAGFNGDGGSSFGGITGLKNALDSGAIVDAASGNVSAATLDLADFEGVCGLLPEYEGARPRWFMHKTFYWNSARRLMNAAGGNTIETLGTMHEPMLLGYPVTFAQVMPSAPGTSTIGAYLGDLSLGATVGRRRGVELKLSEERYFEDDMLAIKATERCAINVHERGDTVRTRPVVALKLAAA